MKSPASTSRLLLTAFAAATSGWPVGSAAGADAPRIAVPTIVVARGAADGAVEFDAVLQPVRQATVTAQVGGNVLALQVKAGDLVKRGQALVKIDDREMRAGVARGDAGVAQADAELRNAQLAMNRNRDLLKSGFISQAAVDSSDTQFRAAQAGLQQAQAARAQAGLAQGFADLHAPFDAVVLATHVEAGDLALPGKALVTLYEPGRLRAIVQVPASRLAAVTGAKQVQVLLPDGRMLTPSAREVLPAADPVSQTVEWRLALPAEAATARPGQTVRVLATGSGAAPSDIARLSVPTQAVLRRGELTAVYVATAQGFALRAVRVAPAAAGSVEVLAGLNAGDKVALDPVRAGLQGAAAAQ